LSCETITGCAGTGQCPFHSSTGACAGTSSGAQVCYSSINSTSCTTNAECENTFGAGYVCLTDMGTEVGCQSRKGRCAYW
jgi:hypothetical protein